MQPRILVLVAGLFGLFGAQRHAAAQASGFAVNRFEPSERGSDWFVNDSLDLRGTPSFAAGAVFDWTYRPLVLFEGKHATGPGVANVITDQVFLHAGGALMVEDRWRIGLSLPIALYQRGEDVSAFTASIRSPDRARVGDLRLSGDVRVVGHYGSVFTAAVGLEAYFPTGSSQLFTSDDTVRLTPRISIAGDGEGLLYAAKLGLAWRPQDQNFEGRRLGSEATLSVAAGVRVNDIFVFGPELWGSTVVSVGREVFERRATPLELLLGGHLTLAKHWKVGSGIGPGLTRGDGTPSMRVLFSFEYAPDVCVDPDGDGICNPFDACPDVDGFKTSERSTNGCPGDRDHDDISDKSDACPDEAGAASDDPTKSGCPRGKEEEAPKEVTPK
jgi:OmpA-OmpF porin, OOP family